MAILTEKEILKPYIKKATGYIKSLLSSHHVEMDNGKTLENTVGEINNTLTGISDKLTPTPWTKLGTRAGLTCYYRYNSFMCQVTIEGSLDGSIFQAWTSYKIGTLPNLCRPNTTLTCDMSGDTLYYEIKSNGDVGIASRAYVSGSHTYWSGTLTYFVI